MACFQKRREHLRISLPPFSFPERVMASESPQRPNSCRPGRRRKMTGETEGRLEKGPPPPVFSEVFILKGFKWLCLHPRHAMWFSRKTGELQ
jgi:hypothetical protein